MFRKQGIILFAFINLTFFASCTRPPHPGSSDSFSPDLLQKGNCPSQIRSYGDITIKINGEGYSGSTDMEWNKNGDFRADIYSLFGNLVASVKADTVGGTVFIQNRTLKFNNVSTMDTLPFSWGKQLTFGQFIFFLTGRVPVDVTDLNKAPDSTLIKGNKAEILYRSGKFDTKMKLNRSSSEIEKVTICSRKQPAFVLKMDSFNKKMARRIEFREDDKNYISIYYEKIKLKQ